jgi:hypothetical protein
MMTTNVRTRAVATTAAVAPIDLQGQTFDCDAVETMASILSRMAMAAL